MDKKNAVVFKQIEREVKELDEYIVNEIMGKKGELKNIYYGSWIYYSPIQINPKVMFLGINPGIGWSRVNGGKRALRLEPFSDGMEYYYEEYNYANQWKKIFSSEILKNKGGEELLRDAFKTNFYYQMTEKAKDLNYIKGSLFRSDEKINLGALSAKWTMQMLDVVSPKILICEGFSVFSELKKCYKQVFEICEKETSMGNPKYLKCGRIENIVVLGVKRILSGIPNTSKELLVKKLDEYL